MNKKTRKLFSLLLGAVFLAGAGLMTRQVMDYRAAEEAKQNALALVQAVRPTETGLPDETVPLASGPEAVPEMTEAPAKQQAPLEEEAKFLLDLDLSPLQEKNADVLGWIHIAGGDVSYPLMRSYDNHDYLYLTWEKRFSNAGSVFLECRNNRSLLDFNTIIYGHHMVNGSIFAPLANYRDPGYLESHSYIYIVIAGDLRRYEIFSVYEAALDSHTYRLYFPDDGVKQAALDHYTGSSLLDTGIIPGVDDYILTLSTCVGNNTYDTRWVVQARLTGIWSR